MRAAGCIFAKSQAKFHCCFSFHNLPRRRIICRAQSDSHSSREHKPNQADALTQSLSSISNNTGRVTQTRNFVLASDNSEASWRALDEAGVGLDTTSVLSCRNSTLSKSGDVTWGTVLHIQDTNHQFAFPFAKEQRCRWVRPLRRSIPKPMHWQELYQLTRPGLFDERKGSCRLHVL